MIMLPQRACAAEMQVKNKSSNGPLRVRNKGTRVLSILQREGIRQLPGICWYLAKCTAPKAVNQGGTADCHIFVNSSLIK